MNADKKKVKDFLYEDLTYKIRGAIFEVYNNLGSGHKEGVYHRALAKEFERARLTFEEEKSLEVVYKGEKVGNYKPDFVVDGKVIVELKALPVVTHESKKQLAHYLKGAGYKLALLVNFGPKLEVIRRVYTNQRESAK